MYTLSCMKSVIYAHHELLKDSPVPTPGSPWREECPAWYMAPSAQPVCWAQRQPRGAASAALHVRAPHVAAVFPPILQVMTLRLTPGQGRTAIRDGSRVWAP